MGGGGRGLRHQGTIKVLGSAATLGLRGVVSLEAISPASTEAEKPSQLLSLTFQFCEDILNLFRCYFVIVVEAKVR